MQYKKYRWSKDYEAAEEELELLLEMLGHSVERNDAAANEVAKTRLNAPHRIWCAEGSMKLNFDGKEVSLQPGDALDILMGSAESATAGVAGCVWYEDSNKIQ